MAVSAAQATTSAGPSKNCATATAASAEPAAVASADSSFSRRQAVTATAL
jgi:hypothetical protein